MEAMAASGQPLPGSSAGANRPGPTSSSHTPASQGTVVVTYVHVFCSYANWKLFYLFVMEKLLLCAIDTWPKLTIVAVCCLSQSVPQLPSCILVTVGSWTHARPSSPAAYQMFVWSVDCGVAPHSVEHLFNCQSHPTQLTVQDLWDNPAAVADFLKMDNWR